MNTRILTALIVLLSAGADLRAVMGVGDVVIVASNPAQELLWASNELPKWIEMINQAEKQVQRAGEMVDLVGHPERFADRIIGSALPAFQASQQAWELEPAAHVLEITRSGWKLADEAEDLKNGVLKVGRTFEVFGKSHTRDRERYLKLALERSLRTRLRDALRRKQKVEAAEAELQKASLDALRRATAHTEISIHQAALTASQQRLALAAAQVDRAQAELQTYIDDAALEQRTRREEERERTEVSRTEGIAAVEAAEAVAMPPVQSGTVPAAADWNPFSS